MASPVYAAPHAAPGQWFISSYQIDKAWQESTGQGVKVAIIDSGVNDTHENLTGKVVAAKDFSGSNTDGKTPIGPEDTIRHGTAVAGVIAGNGTGVGPTGVAPDAQLLSASMWLGGGGPQEADTSRQQAAEAIRWAVDNGAKVINMSLGWSDPAWPEYWDDAFAYAYDKDAVIIACVGNASQGATRAWSPATVPGVVGVGGLKKDDTVDEQSTAPGIAVDLMGPAQQIPVPYYTGGYAEAEGCSFAAPFIAGVAALIRAKHPDYSADDVVTVLESTATPVKGHTSSSDPDPIVGYGRVNPTAALDATKPGETTSAKEELQDWVRMHRRAPQPTPTASGVAAAGQPKVEAQGVERMVRGPRRTNGPLIVGGVLGVGALVFALGVVMAVRRRRGAQIDEAYNDH